ncbi:MAG TPA: TetR family transcriptional regulator [Solirubrobacteraceae bacterium]|nr:TetR family transcriptional regulator [Solirubrobacteraceae bacterium]
MVEPGLRERNKRRTRELIAGTAARLFAQRGYEHVSVLEIAAAAQVSEQTIYNHFPTKSELVLDRDHELRDQLTTAIRHRPPGVSPAAAIQDVALSLLDALRAMDAEQARGGLGYLSTRSPTVRRLALEMTDRHADAIAEVLAAEPNGPTPAIAKVQAIALAWIIQTITDLAGHCTAAGQSPAQTAIQLRPTVLAIIAELKTWPALGGRDPDDQP